MTFKDNFIKLRKEKNISVEDMAKALSCSLKELEDLESAKREPALDEILAAAKFFGVSTDFLLGNVQEKKESQPFDPFSALAGLALPGGFDLNNLPQADYNEDDEDEELLMELMAMVSAIDTRRVRKEEDTE